MQVATPPATETWVPVPHVTLLDEVSKALDGGGYNLVSQSHALAREGGHYFGLLQVDNPAFEQTNTHSLVIGLRNSHTKVFPIGLVVGYGVFVCDNLAFSGEIRISRKHTVNAVRDLPRLVHAAVGRIFDMHTTQENRIEHYKTTQLDNRDAEHLIIECLRADVITTTQLPRVVKEWDRPSHEEFGDPTAWRLFNAFTENLRGRGQLAKLPRATQRLHSVMDGFCGFGLSDQLKDIEDAEIMEAA
jgi:hypothetical protein